MCIGKDVATTARCGPSRLCLMFAFVVAALFSGCSRFALPAIDPNGSRIFLPPPNSTQLQLPRLHTGDNFLPDAAYTTPPTPPPCVDGSGNSICNLFDRKGGLANRLHSGKPGKAGELQLTPLIVVAPVDGEVTLLAGVCGKDGHYVTRQPLEWMLSPESVGTFIDVGDDRPGKLARLFYHKDPKVEKLDVDFARGRTSSKPTVITKGSPQCADDIQVKEGQTWLSISSPSEGVSRITALAPDSEIWDQRRQTATIHWVDARWVFPPIPLPAARGEVVDIFTRVTRADDLVPAVDWIVKYTIIDPAVARFDTIPPADGSVVAVRVNQDGKAPVRIVAGPAGRGTSPVLIDVIRPAVPTDNLPELRLGGGQTIVSFTAPVLVLEGTGPEVAGPGQELRYVASMGNAGDTDIANTTLTARIPDGWTLARAPSPQPTTITPTYLVWEQGILPTGEQLDVNVDLIAGRANSYNVVFEARGEPNLTAEKSFPVEVVSSSIEARFAPSGGITQAEIGESITCEVDVRNTGATALNNVTLAIETDQGLTGIDKLGQPSTFLEQNVGVILPGQTKSAGIALQVQREGELEATLKVIANQTVLATRSFSIAGIRPRPKTSDIGASIRFVDDTSEFAVGDSPTAIIRVENPGETRLSDIQVNIEIPPTLEFSQVDRATASENRFNFQLSAPQTGIWTPFDLLPAPDANSGAPFREMKLQFKCLGPTEQGSVQVRATAQEGVEQTASAPFRVRAGIQPPSGNGGNNTPPRQGTWNVSLRDSPDPVVVGRDIRYFLVIENQQNQGDSDVEIFLTIPDGIDIQSVSSDGVQLPIRTPDSDRRIRTLPVVNYVRSGDLLYYTIVVKPRVVDTLVLRASVRSRNIQAPVGSDVSTTVIAR